MPVQPFFKDPSGSHALRPGPEIPISSKGDLIRIAIEILRLTEHMA